MRRSNLVLCEINIASDLEKTVQCPWLASIPTSDNLLCTQAMLTKTNRVASKRYTVTRAHELYNTASLTAQAVTCMMCTRTVMVGGLVQTMKLVHPATCFHFHGYDCCCCCCCI
eukprot:m.28034 g.28034  ORF g.28034 m.28034 type:complete len:114 (-) comp9007_c0_seq1:32-373(-)